MTVENIFIDWMYDEEYSTSHWPSTDLRDLRDRFEEELGESIKLSQIRNVLESKGFKIEGFKAYIWQPKFVRRNGKNIKTVVGGFSNVEDTNL